METINSVLRFFKLVVITTFSQLVGILGLLFIFGLVLYFLARITRITYVKTVGSKFDIYITGWIGIPIHELGHAIFCILFGHRIVKMKLFSPNPDNSSLGYVQHEFNSNSTFQRIGNFFIGVGPIIFGVLVLYALLHYLVPNNTNIISSISSQSESLVVSLKGENTVFFTSLWTSIRNTTVTLFSKSNFVSPKFYLFLYISLCISSHMQLSPPDIKGA